MIQLKTVQVGLLFFNSENFLMYAVKYSVNKMSVCNKMGLINC